MTTINYKINNQTGRNLTAKDWVEAQALQQKTIQEEITQLQWFTIVAVITNNDGTITMTGIDANGVPQCLDENGNIVPYVDTTVVP